MNNRREFIKNLIGTGLALATGPRVFNTRAFALTLMEDDPWRSVMPGILARIKPPVFANRDFLITKFGAQGDGQANSTAAFATAIAECSKAGGGRVVVTEGSFLTSAIHLKSKDNLVVSNGATIKFSKNPADYLPVVFTR